MRTRVCALVIKDTTARGGLRETVFAKSSNLGFPTAYYGSRGPKTYRTIPHALRLVDDLLYSVLPKIDSHLNKTTFPTCPEGKRHAKRRG